MQIDEIDFHKFLSVKEGLDITSVRHCTVRVRLINKWFGNKELNKSTVEEFFFYLINDKRLKNSTLNTYRFVFRHLSNYCKDRGVPYDFLDGFKSFKKTKADIVIFTPEEIEAIINTSLQYGKLYGKDCSFLDFRYRTLTMFLAYTGCRFSEAADLKIKRLDLSAGRATFIDTKSNENRSVYFVEPLTSGLKLFIDGRDPNDYVFRNSQEKRVNAPDYSEDLKKRAEAAGVTKRTFPHNFRHSYITHMLEAGVPITEVASLAGHKDIRVTFSNYMHLADKTLQRAAMMHPLVRKNVDPHEIVKNIKETIEKFHLDTDPRFKFSVRQDNNSLCIDVSF